jgi:hypothetical protein
MSEPKPTREEIRQRISACDASELEEYRDHARSLRRIQIAREYVQACCPHDTLVPKYEISHFVRKCADCGQAIKESK